jgi:tRNA dimethylallyltransferase
LTTETSPKQPVILLLGATAVGKTSAVLALSKHVDAVIYADPWVGYKDLNIGVAKPSALEMASLPHYMINLLGMDEQLNVTDFVQQSDSIIALLGKQGKVPLLSGGSLYYLRHFLYGLPSTPAVDSATRAKVAGMLEELGSKDLHAKLMEVDAEHGARLAWQDTYRVTRALEVYYDSGRPLSSFALEKNRLRDKYDFLIIELVREREQLYERINSRVEQMWQAGLVQEVEHLKAKGLTAASLAARAIGYREFFQVDLSDAEIKERIKKNTRNYAKRQLTFLRSLPINYQVAGDDIATLLRVVENFLSDKKYKKYSPQDKE